MKNKILLLAIVMAFITGTLFAGCTSQQPVSETIDGKINVMVSVLPQVTFVNEIGGDKVSVSEMIPPGFSPATYEPSPEQLKKLSDADIYFRIGHIPFEKAQMGKLEDVNPGMQAVDTSEGITLLELAEHHHEGEDEAEHGHEDGDKEDHEAEHGEGHEEEHSHEGGDDPHIWLSPNLVKTQAGHIYDALVAYSPENEDYFTQNYNSFIQKLEALDNKLKETFEPIEGGTILVFHPAFGYLANDYGFTQEAIEIEGKDPSPQQLEEIVSEAKKDNVKVIFVQKQFSTKSAEAIAEEIDGVVVQIDPLAEDYFANLEDMANVIVNAIQ